MIVKQLNRLNYGDKSPSKAQPTVSRNNAKVTRLARKSTPLKSALLRRKQELEESLDKSTYAKTISRDQTLIPSVPRSGAATIDGDDGALGLPTSRPSTAQSRPRTAVSRTRIPRSVRYLRRCKEPSTTHRAPPYPPVAPAAMFKSDPFAPLKSNSDPKYRCKMSSMKIIWTLNSPDLE